MTFSGTVEALCDIVINVSWQATILGLVVLAIRYIFGRIIRPEMMAALWIIVLVRLLLSGGPESPFSLSNFTGVHVMPESQSTDSPGRELNLEIDFFIIRLISMVWITGVLMRLARWGRLQAFWKEMFRSCELVGDPDILNALADAENDLGQDPQVELVHSRFVQSPALYGLFRPRLIIPTTMMDQLTPHQWYLIFRHEVAHMKRGDMLTMHLIRVFQAIHWFNPLLRLIFRQMETDMELAADGVALRNCRPGEKKAYARTLLRFFELPPLDPGQIQPIRVGFWNEEREIFSRFHAIAGPPKSYQISIVFILATVTVLAIIGLTDPMFPRPIQPLSFDTIRLLTD